MAAPISTAPIPLDKVKDNEYSNWLKVTLALYYMKSGVHTFMQSEVDCLHQSLVQKIYSDNKVPLSPCTTCRACHVQKSKSTGIWNFTHKCNSHCEKWFDNLLALHSNPKSEKIYWENSDIASWPFKPWECAKIFMPRGQPPSNVGPVQCDAQAILTLVSSCKHFHLKLSRQGLSLTRKIISVRNEVLHNGEMKIPDADRLIYIQQMIQFLEDPVSLKSNDDCKAAVDHIQWINNDSVDVFLNVKLQMIALQEAVDAVSRDLGLNENRLDSVVSLEKEYRQLITKKLEAVENTVRTFKRDIQSFRKQTEQQQVELSKTMSASVSRLEAKVEAFQETLLKLQETGERTGENISGVEG